MIRAGNAWSGGALVPERSRRALAAALAIAAVTPADAAAQATPSMVMPGVVSGDRNDYNLSLSADGGTMVFARSEAAFARARIMVSERRPGPDGSWSEPRPIAFTDERYRDSDPWLTPDGQTLYFVSDRPAPGRGDRHDLDIWRSAWRDGRWQAPEHLGDVVNRSGEELGPEVHDGTLYFATALRSGTGGLDIYAASPTAGGFAEPRPLPAPINSAESESDFTLSGDGRTALFWRSVGGRGLIHVARRDDDGRWSDPEPLPDAVNIGGFNFTPSFGPDEGGITFASDRERAGQPAGMADIYRAPPPVVVPVPTAAPSVLPEVIESRNVVAAEATWAGRPALRVELTAEEQAAQLSGAGSNRPTYAIVDEVIGDGVIEVEVAADRSGRGGTDARGFVGVAFHLSPDAEAFETVYLRMANGTLNTPAPESPRDARAVQYAAHPDFHFETSREQAPGVYERGAPVALGAWHRLRLELDGPRAIASIDGVEVLRVNDLRRAGSAGRIGLWVGGGTTAYFRNLVVQPEAAAPQSTQPAGEAGRAAS
jgi:hypothetical protein